MPDQNEENAEEGEGEQLPAGQGLTMVEYDGTRGCRPAMSGELPGAHYTTSDPGHAEASLRSGTRWSMPAYPVGSEVPICYIAGAPGGQKGDSRQGLGGRFLA